MTCAGFLDHFDGLLGSPGRQFTWMAEMGHQGSPAAGTVDFFKQSQQIIGIVVVQEAVRPVRERFGANADVLQVGDITFQNGVDIGLENGCFHNHRIAAGEEDIGDLRVLAEICYHLVGFFHGDLEIIHADELGPAEAEGAVGMTCLTLSREEKSCFFIFMLHAF